MSSPIQAKLLPTLRFLLDEWIDVPFLLQREHFAEHATETVHDLLDAVSAVAGDVIEPVNRVLDQVEPTFDGTAVVVPEEAHRAWGAHRDLEVMAASHPVEHGGWQLPRVVDFAVKTLLGSASVSFGPTMLTDANASLLLAHGTEAQREVFARPQLAGRWAGTMCMSEPQAGSSLTDIETRAVPDGDDHASDPWGPRHRITGQKMWISGGDHDLTDNIVHLVLARTARADGTHDPSTRGLSLFVVPKVLPAVEGRPEERNDVAVTGLNHKLGFRGIPNTALAFGQGAHEPGGRPGAVGYLVGSPGDGLRQMFHMMNAARIEIGLCAAALGFAGFATSLDYAKTRLQGRPVRVGGKDASDHPVPITEHDDVRRMLLAQKAYAEGGIALGLYAARLLDEQTSGDADDAAEAGRLLDILTPVVKSWPSEWCLEANSLAIQVMGGAGYVRDHPVEQLWRDNRLNMIHEGTHGIQAQDLLGRKVRLEDGAALAVLERRLLSTVERAGSNGMAAEADALRAAWADVVATTDRAWSTGDPAVALSDATAYLRGFGHVVLAWIWLDVALAAAAGSHPEAEGKRAAMRYFFTYELPRTTAWLAVVDPEQDVVRRTATSSL